MEGSIWHGVIGTGIRESHGGIVLVHAGNYVMIEERVTECFPILGMKLGRVLTLS